MAHLFFFFLVLPLASLTLSFFVAFLLVSFADLSCSLLDYLTAALWPEAAPAPVLLFETALGAGACTKAFLSVLLTSAMGTNSRPPPASPFRESGSPLSGVPSASIAGGG